MARSSRLLNLSGRTRFAATRWSRLHAGLYARTGGRFLPRWFGGRVIVLEVAGRRTGQLRRTPLIHVEVDGNPIVIASNAGNDRMPVWWLNLRDAGEATVVRQGKSWRVRPRVAEGDERAELWGRFAAEYPGIDDYARYTSREFPVVVLEPAEPASRQAS